MLASPSRTGERDTTRILRLAKRAVDAAHLDDLLPRAGRAKKSNAGRPAELGRYDLIAVFCVIFELAWSGHPVTLANIVRAVHVRYTDEQMRIIGLPDFRAFGRSPERTAALRVLPEADGPAKNLGDKEQTNEYERFWEFWDAATEPMNDTPMKLKWAHVDRPTRAAVRSARANPDLASKTLIADRVANRLQLGALVAANDKWFPGKALHEGVLRHHRGDVVVDETHIIVGLGNMSITAQPEGKAPGNLRAEVTVKNQRVDHAATMGLTLAIAEGRPNCERVPSVALGMCLRHGTAGSLVGLQVALWGIEENGLRVPHESRSRQHVSIDQGFANKDGVQEFILDLGYLPVFEYAKNRKLFAELDRGLYWFQGPIHCPGVAREEFTLPRLAAREDFNVNQLQAHLGREWRLNATVMPTDGRPKRASGRRRGGQRQGDPPPEPVMKLVLWCPAVRMQSRCELIEQSLLLDPTTHPTVPNPPAELHIADRPECCQQGRTTVNLTPSQFKLWQPLMAGSFEHLDFFSSMRSRNEWHHSRIVSPNYGGNVRQEQVAARKNPFTLIAVAMAIAVTSIKNIESFEDVVRRNGGRPPMSTGPSRAAKRAAVLATRARSQHF